jgi:opacity protein-like surface antigen
MACAMKWRLCEGRVTMETKSRLTAVVALALASLASPAWAKDRGYEAQVSAGGGVSGFITDAADQTKVGGAWDVRVRLRTPILLGAEIGYVGTANGVSDRMAASAPNGIILGDGVEVNAVLSVLPHDPLIDPYVFAGAGYTRFSLVNETTFNPSVVRDKDNAFVLPSGAGLALRLADNFLVDARFTYRAVFDDGMIFTKGPGTDAVNMSQWGATARVAYAF